MATRLYIPLSNAQIVPATTKGSWNAVPSARAYDLSPVKYGRVINFISEAETASTAPFSTLLFRAISSKLAAQTLSGDFNVILGVHENASDADFYWHIHIWVSVGDTDTVRATLVNNYTETGANEWTTTLQGRALQFDFTITPALVTSGDRIVVEVGFVSRNVTSSSRTASIWVGTQKPTTFDDAPDLAVAEAAATTKAGSINFTDDIVFETVTDAIIHESIQVVQQFTAPETARIGHAIIQLAQIDPAVAELAHAVIQVVEGLPVGNISGLYYVNPSKAQSHDSYYGNVNKKIPDPTIKTALLGE